MKDIFEWIIYMKDKGTEALLLSAQHGQEEQIILYLYFFVFDLILKYKWYGNKISEYWPNCFVVVSVNLSQPAPL